jgi:hypothetical protein
LQKESALKYNADGSLALVSSAPRFRVHIARSLA